MPEEENPEYSKIATLIVAAPDKVTVSSPAAIFSA
jgi:hypothetical protein